MNHRKILLGLALSLLVGAGSRLGGIPAPSPPALSGALLVFMMSLGYYLVDRYLASRPAQEKKHCGGHDLAKKE
ncbi:DUF1427 family protein [Vogesella sp. LIG4]|uniref:DUF1427 family protein n=1 Tax=Vogesella sp. LIG4 TaxID=1192162 RepID=UPI00081F861E|nr:DUF1427 family protein [Vogesella sp. LIG4]SCK30154.1 XapX domain-containing protein [Vogesella sp. LIG4]